MGKGMEHRAGSVMVLGGGIAGIQAALDLTELGYYVYLVEKSPVRGDLYVAWQDSRWTGVDQATLAISRDGGATWSDAQLESAAPPNAPTFTVSTAVKQAG